MGLAAVGLAKGPYPILWGIGPITAGPLVDRVDRKPLIATGTPGRAGLVPVLVLVLLNRSWLAGLVSAVIRGLGTALVHPTLIASVSDDAHPVCRADAVGTSPDPLLAGHLADRPGMNAPSRWTTGHRPGERRPLPDDERLLTGPGSRKPRPGIR
ncbi:hypothetical protein SNE510_07540 [Streptomyces sp. NE5-10]|uniref:hypothetical protein n=1 Tax=Streptomyces sp. NE5-10 TaxID=2759674 RepID=UPI0019032CBA|nr:hypothetical protein [Streptomyces sp. NE5-10]GHJ91235.1 hypothetical protein SNE510_07540 [Streptomyces sp. NE5-10]